MPQTTELEALLLKYEKLSIPVAMEILANFGVNPDAPVGTIKHRVESYYRMMDAALPIFKAEAQAASHDYPHIPYITFQRIQDSEPK